MTNIDYSLDDDDADGTPVVCLWLGILVIITCIFHLNHNRKEIYDCV